jgi:hypothetical protein
MQSAKLRAQYDLAIKKRIVAIKVLREALEEDKRTTKELMNT